MLVTMFTDASVIHRTGTAAWALWAKSERGTIRAAGIIKGKCTCSNEAELKAIANGLDALVRSHILFDGDRVLVTADNVSALSLVSPPRTNALKDRLAKVTDAIDQIARRHQLVLITKHVKAHSGRGQPRLWVHSDCDRRARGIARSEHERRLCSVGGA